jgi:hypothetical protein
MVNRLIDMVSRNMVVYMSGFHEYLNNWIVEGTKVNSESLILAQNER